MEPEGKKWSVGEIVTLPKAERPLKKSGSRTFKRYVNSRYICIREASEHQNGILLKVLGKAMADDIAMVGHEPFSKDYSEDLFESTTYFSYPFPTAYGIKEVLDIFRSNPSLIDTFENASMHFNPKSRFWVKETSSRLIFKKKPRYYDVRSDKLGNATEDVIAYRLTVVYFNQSLELTW